MAAQAAVDNVTPEARSAVLALVAAATAKKTALLAGAEAAVRLLELQTMAQQSLALIGTYGSEYGAVRAAAAVLSQPGATDALAASAYEVSPSNN